MSDFLQMNLNNLSGIRNKSGQIADRRLAQAESRKSKIFDAFKSGAKAYTDATAATKDRKMEAWTAKNLADERDGERDWNRGEGFEQQKELLGLDAKNRMALARLTAAAKGDTETAFDLNAVVGDIMSIGVRGWDSPAFRPEEKQWDDNAVTDFWNAADSLIGMYDEAQQQDIRTKVNAMIDQYPVYSAPIADEGTEGFFDKAGNFITKLGSGGNESFPSIYDTYNSQEGFSPEVTVPLQNITPSGRSKPAEWTIMQDMIKQISGDPDLMQDDRVKMYIKDAKDGEFQQTTGLDDFIRVLEQLGAINRSTPATFN